MKYDTEASGCGIVSLECWTNISLCNTCSEVCLFYILIFIVYFDAYTSRNIHSLTQALFSKSHQHTEIETDSIEFLYNRSSIYTN